MISSKNAENQRIEKVALTGGIAGDTPYFRFPARQPGHGKEIALPLD